MRLADVLSKSPTPEFKQVEGFLDGKSLAIGKQRKITAGRVGINFFCKTCDDIRTFSSPEDLYCIGVNESLVSIDSVLNCQCGASVQIWFLVDCDGSISGPAPEIRILKRTEKLSDNVMIDTVRYGNFTELLEKAQRAYRDRLGAGAMVYLRKVYELITVQTATAAGISCLTEKGKRKAFKSLLEEVDKQCSIIPREFSANGYRLFGTLSDVVHGDSDEEVALAKFELLQRLILGVLDNVKNNGELMAAIGRLGW